MEENLTFGFFLFSAALGVGLAMDAFSVSLANGLNEPEMGYGKMCLIGAAFAVFQAVMPTIGWICVHTIVEKFRAFEKFVPWIALILLLYIGTGMVRDGLKEKKEPGTVEKKKLTLKMLFVQAVATSIDALSVGFTIAEYPLGKALFCNTVIAVMTFAISVAGVIIGRKAGTKLGWKASVLGGVILICIGLEIFIEGVFF